MNKREIDVVNEGIGSEMLERQRKLIREQTELRELAENMPCGYRRCTTDGGFLLEFVSSSFLETVGYTKDEVIGKPVDIDMLADTVAAAF